MSGTLPFSMAKEAEALRTSRMAATANSCCASGDMALSSASFSFSAGVSSREVCTLPAEPIVVEKRGGGRVAGEQARTEQVLVLFNVGCREIQNPTMKKQIDTHRYFVL